MLGSLERNVRGVVAASNFLTRSIDATNVYYILEVVEYTNLYLESL